MFVGPLGIKAFEDLGQGLIGDTGTCVFDNDKDTVFTLARPNTDRVTILAERDARW